MRVRDAAERLEVSPATVYALVSSGKLKCYRIGTGRGCIRFSQQHIDDYLRGAESTITVAPPPRRRKLKHL